LVIGKGHKGGFATLAERKSRLYLALPIANKTAQNANDATSIIIFAIAFSIFLMLMAQVFVYLALPIANKTAQNANDAINKRLTPLH
jgi:hypothetical protein